MLRPGIYEQLIDRRLAQDLDQLPENQKATAAIDQAEAGGGGRLRAGQRAGEDGGLGLRQVHGPSRAGGSGLPSCPARPARAIGADLWPPGVRTGSLHAGTISPLVAVRAVARRRWTSLQSTTFHHAVT